MSALETVSPTTLLREVGAHTVTPESPPEAFEAVLRKLPEMLNGSDRLRVATVRQVLVRQFKFPAPMVDAALNAHDHDDEGGDRETFVFEDTEPWPKQVDGKKLLANLNRMYTRFLVLPDGGATTLPLFTLHAHAHDASDVSPNLAFVSAVKRSGKTLGLLVIAEVAPRPLPTSNMTPAMTYRLVDKYSPTLIMDEADAWLKGSDELRGLLNAGHNRRMANVPRAVGDDHEPKIFRVYCPKVIALIGSLPGTLEDRSIVIHMRRKRPEDQVERFQIARGSEFEPLRRKCARWAADHMDELRAADPEIPPELHDRAADNWRPLLAIADIIGGVWPERARQAAKLITGLEIEAENTLSIQLVEDIVSLFGPYEDKIHSADIEQKLSLMEDRPWREISRGKPISSNKVARMLRPFGIKPKKVWIGEINKNGYELQDFRDTVERYLPDVPVAGSVPVAKKQPEQSSMAELSDDPAFRSGCPVETGGSGEHTL